MLFMMGVDMLPNMGVRGHAAQDEGQGGGSGGILFTMRVRGMLLKMGAGV